MKSMLANTSNSSAGSTRRPISQLHAYRRSYKLIDLLEIQILQKQIEVKDLIDKVAEFSFDKDDFDGMLVE